MVRVTKTTGLRLILLLVCLFLYSFNTNVKAASSNESIFIAVNDELVVFSDAKPRAVAGVTFVPLRSLATVIQAAVIYDENENSVIIRKENLFLKINLSENTYISLVDGINEKAAKLPFKIQKTTDDRILLPLRFIADYFQFTISYYEAGPIARLIEKNASLTYTDEQLYSKYREQIETEKKQWKQAKAQEKAKKIAYLTFDDGPNRYTAKILDTLQEYEAKATFFMIEPQLKDYKAVVQRLVKEEHTIASHSVTHNKTKVYKSPKTLLDEMNTTRATILAIAGVDSKLIRVPYGSKPYLTKEYRDILASNHLQVWDWNVDSKDWQYTSDEIISTVTNQVASLKQKGITPVILFHNSQNTVEALPKVIKYLKSEGFVLEAYQPEQHIMVNFWNDERL